MESAFTLDKESHTLALICSELQVTLAFDSRETLIQWQVHTRSHFPEGKSRLLPQNQMHVPISLSERPENRVQSRDPFFGMQGESVK